MPGRTAGVTEVLRSLRRAPPQRLGRRSKAVPTGCALLLSALLVQAAYDPVRMRQSAERLGPRIAAALPALQALIARGAHADGPRRFAEVNDFFNDRIGFVADDRTWGQDDYWASPLEALDKGFGDCEDYAIAKYFSLVAQGVAVQRLRLVYVRAVVDTRSQAHMVLAYYADPAADPLILDNLSTATLPASRRPDLTPVFSFNTDGLWAGTGAQAVAGDPQARLSRWREVVAKAREQGFD